MQMVPVPSILNTLTPITNLFAFGNDSYRSLIEIVMPPF